MIAPPKVSDSIDQLFEQHCSSEMAVAKSTVKQRLSKLKQIADYLKDPDNEKRLIEALYQDLRKPPVEVYGAEIGPVLSNIKFIKANLKRWAKDKVVDTTLAMMGTSSYIHYEPKGKALIISPWNYPFQLGVLPLIYAIAAGNTVILKPSEISKATSAFLARMFKDLFDEKELAVVEGDVSVSTKLLSLPFNHVYFTGSPQVGKIVMAAAAQHLASVTLELGGKSPAIIDETANMTKSAEKAAWAKIMNNGQTCIAPDYMIIPEAKQNTFVTAFSEAVSRFYNADGKGIQQSSDYGRIINKKHFDRIKNLLDDAVEKGANVELGGNLDEADLFIPPTVLTNVSEDMDIMQEEIFGPILPVVTYNQREEVINILRKRPKPLAFYIESKSKKNIKYFIDNSSAGGTIVNDYMLGVSNPHLPFGGVNNSGIGKALGLHGFVEFSNERGITKRKWGNLKMIFPPFNEKIMKMMKTLYKWA